MTATQKFIEDAIKGGWRRDIPEHQHQSFIDGIQGDIRFMVLQPLAWQAVCRSRDLVSDESLWRSYFHEFIDHLANDDDIETALSKLI